MVEGVSSHATGQVQLLCEMLKAPLIVPLLNLGVYICLAMSLMLFMERLYMGIVIILVKLFWKKPQQRYNYKPLQDDVELGSSNFPLVLVQIPMFNEREVKKKKTEILCFYFLALELSFRVLVCFWARFTRCPSVLCVSFHGPLIVSLSKSSMILLTLSLR